MQIDLNKYQNFVEAVTSKESNSLSEFTGRIHDLAVNSAIDNKGVPVNLPLLMTAAIGMAAECGEFCELPKKIVFQGKPLNEESIFHMKRELGDVMWYWVNACRSLNLDPNDVIAENVRKLEARYPGGSFDPYYSENRKSGDL